MTDFVEEESTRFALGYSLISVVLLNISYHIISMVWMMYKTVLKPFYFKMKAKLSNSSPSQIQKKAPVEEIMESSAKGLVIEEIKEVEEEKEEDDLEKKMIKKGGKEKKSEI